MRTKIRSYKSERFCLKQTVALGCSRSREFGYTDSSCPPASTRCGLAKRFNDSSQGGFDENISDPAGLSRS
jgi:hypothetical protein